jgi:DNA-binding transcriptional regulator YiaG
LNKSLFDIEMTKAEVMAGVERTGYWTGYQNGLQRRFHGENFCTQAQHDAWMDEIDNENPDMKERGQGYRDGYLGVVDLQDPANGIQILRRWRGWSIEELARRAGVTLETVRAWEQGQMPAPEELQVLAKLRSE